MTSSAEVEFTRQRSSGDYARGVDDPSPSWVAEFTASMPAGYRTNYPPALIHAHARVAAARGGAAASVGRFESSRHPGTALCVVAEDRPGLLATISAGLVLTGLDVLDAEAYTRKTPARRAEAVDLFWVRGVEADGEPAPVDDALVDRLTRTLIDLLEGRLDARAAERPSGAESPAAGTLVRFLTGSDGALNTLEIETSDRSGLLLALAKALFEARVQILESEVRTLEGRVQDRFLITELDDSPISDARRLELQVAVLSALEKAAR